MTNEYKTTYRYVYFSCNFHFFFLIFFYDKDVIHFHESLILWSGSGRGVREGAVRDLLCLAHFGRWRRRAFGCGGMGFFWHRRRFPVDVKENSQRTMWSWMKGSGWVEEGKWERPAYGIFEWGRAMNSVLCLNLSASIWLMGTQSRANWYVIGS